MAAKGCRIQDPASNGAAALAVAEIELRVFFIPTINTFGPSPTAELH